MRVGEGDRAGSIRHRRTVGAAVGARDLARRYLAEGWWTDATLGGMVADGLAGMGAGGLPGSLGDPALERHVRRRRPGGPPRWPASCGHGAWARATVVVIQLPNWLEAGDHLLGRRPTWARSWIPIVHFYGAKEVEYIIRATSPDVVVTADRFGHSDYLATYTELLAGPTRPAVAGRRRDAPTATCPSAATAFESLLDGDPITAPTVVDPDAPAIVGFTSGTTRDPKGVVHSHRTIGCEARQLDYMFPKGGPPQITGAPVGHFIGMLNAFLIAAAAPAPGPPGRRVGPRRGAAPDERGGARRRRWRHLLPDQPARPSRTSPRGTWP